MTHNHAYVSGPPYQPTLDELQHRHDRLVNEALDHERIARNYRQAAQATLAEMRQLRTALNEV